MPKVFWRQVRSRGLYPNWDLVIKEVASALDSKAKPLAESYFQRIVQSWDEGDRPAFRSRKRITKDFVALYTFPTGPMAWLWKLISRTGARPHPIDAKNVPFLIFLWGGYHSYVPHTDTEGGYEGPGEVEDGDVMKMLHVDHPGFDPRNFEKYIAEWILPRLRRIVENAFRRGVRRARSNPKPVSVRNQV